MIEHGGREQRAGLWAARAAAAGQGWGDGRVDSLGLPHVDDRVQRIPTVVKDVRPDHVGLAL